MFIPAQTQSAFDPRRPFSRAEARAAGLSPEMLLSRRFHKIFWDAYVAHDVAITPLLRAKAVIRLVPPGSYISHHAAAELWGAVVPADGATPSRCRRPIDGKFDEASVRTIGRLRGRPRFVKACLSRLLNRRSWTSLRSASGWSTWWW
jgi:hypothetical protein